MATNEAEISRIGIALAEVRGRMVAHSALLRAGGTDQMWWEFSAALDAANVKCIAMAPDPTGPVNEPDGST